MTLVEFMVLHSFVGRPLALEYAHVDCLLNAGHDRSISERFYGHAPHPDSIPNKHDPNRDGAQVLYA